MFQTIFRALDIKFCENRSIATSFVYHKMSYYMLTIGLLITKSHDVHNCSLTFRFNYENVVLTQKKKYKKDIYKYEN